MIGSLCPPKKASRPPTAPGGLLDELEELELDEELELELDDELEAPTPTPWAEAMLLSCAGNQSTNRGPLPD